MKNLAKILAIAFIMVSGVQFANAQSLSQDADRPEVIAKKKVTELASKLELNDSQERALFRYYTSYEMKYKKNIAGKDLNEPKVAAEKKEYVDDLKANIKKTLNEEQYNKWLGFFKEDL
ncbi:hypothetical protein INR76_06805 [Marixanthomonas sp. SCSIO 43207]|uniref:hypothetical protein n=1 Tax=Marixanthomonas sp. SCSIO 43207 TaxID=2779360 RepID=UPI001CA98289|nr:hypothetical protein [Marixanthomonas sp. SCSIO 43207]UAB82461.1 hypothetical protein INR76_06805 [Marixanthomonas sp. SCSIO 43207]